MQIKSDRLEQSATYEFRLPMEAVQLRRQAEGMPAGIRRDELLQKARQTEAAAHVNRRLASLFLQP